MKNYRNRFALKSTEGEEDQRQINVLQNIVLQSSMQPRTEEQEEEDEVILLDLTGEVEEELAPLTVPSNTLAQNPGPSKQREETPPHPSTMELVDELLDMEAFQQRPPLKQKQEDKENNPPQQEQPQKQPQQQQQQQNQPVGQKVLANMLASMPPRFSPFLSDSQFSDISAPSQNEGDLEDDLMPPSCGIKAGPLLRKFKLEFGELYRKRVSESESLKAELAKFEKKCENYKKRIVEVEEEKIFIGQVLKRLRTKQ